MKPKKTVASLCGLVLAATGSLALVHGATAAPVTAEPTLAPGKDRRVDQPSLTKASNARDARISQHAAGQTPSARDEVQLPTSYPSQPALNFYRDNVTGPNGEADFNTAVPGLMSHPDIAPFLTDLMQRSNRVSVQTVGQSTQGRDLYLVTVTAPETESFTAQQTAWRDKIRNNPAAAATDQALLSGYKTPIWITNNIHGNEWEGTDAALRYIEHLATAPWTEVGSILRNNRVYFSPSLNPDGRTLATRATALGFDPNRDMITLTNPEPESFVETADAVQAIYSADFHGYTGVLQMEPTGPPHGSNYEYDLYIPHNYALARAVEDHIVAEDIPGNTYFDVVNRKVVPANTGPDTAHIKIPYRDTPSGWDDFPPIFTAQYAAFYGAITATVELPLGRNRNAADTGSGGVLISADRAKVNSEVAYETMEAIVDYLNKPTTARDLLKNQIETFRRGAAGEKKTALTTGNIADVAGPDEWKTLWDVADDQEPVTMPRAYVVPMGSTQRSATDAIRLVDRLIDVGIEVKRLDASATIGGTSYPAGSYVVDMHQPLRGLANALLDLGEDISQKLPSMYDISAWSLSYLWGADVDKVGLTEDGSQVPGTPVDATTSIARMPAAGYTTFDLAGVADYQALNALLEDGVEVSMIPDGSVVVGPGDHGAVAAVSQQFGIPVSAATGTDLTALADERTKGLKDLTIAYAGNQDDRVSLEQLGFDDLIQVTAANVSAAALADADLLWVGSNFNPSGAARAAVESWLAAGGALLGRGAAGFNAASSFSLLSATMVAGNGSGNGIVAVDTPAGSVLEPYKQDYGFVYPAVSFTSLGEGTKAEQTYDAAKTLLAGHWRETSATNGPATAQGNASVISGVNAATGAKALVFGTQPVYRTHPKGSMSQVARALFWGAAPGTEVTGPVPPTATATPTPTVTPTVTPTTQPVVKVPSRTKLKVKVSKSAGKAKLVIRVKASGMVPTGKLKIKRNGKVLKIVKLRKKQQGKRVVKVRLVVGKNAFRVRYLGNAKIRRSTSPVRTLRWP